MKEFSNVSFISLLWAFPLDFMHPVKEHVFCHVIFFCSSVFLSLYTFHWAIHFYLPVFIPYDWLLKSIIRNKYKFYILYHSLTLLLPFSTSFSTSFNVILFYFLAFLSLEWSCLLITKFFLCSTLNLWLHHLLLGPYSFICKLTCLLYWSLGVALDFFNTHNFSLSLHVNKWSLL